MVSLWSPDALLAPSYPPYLWENVRFDFSFQQRNCLKIQLHEICFARKGIPFALQLHPTGGLYGTPAESKICRDCYYNNLELLIRAIFSGELQNFVGMHPASDDREDHEGTENPAEFSTYADQVSKSNRLARERQHQRPR